MYKNPTMNTDLMTVISNAILLRKFIGETVINIIHIKINFTRHTTNLYSGKQIHYSVLDIKPHETDCEMARGTALYRVFLSPMTV